MENTHMIHPDRFDKLLLILCLAFALAVKAGLYRETKEKIPIKKHGRRLFSLFSYGLDWIKEKWTQTFLQHLEKPLPLLHFKELSKNVPY